MWHSRPSKVAASVATRPSPPEGHEKGAEGCSAGAWLAASTFWRPPARGIQFLRHTRERNCGQRHGRGAIGYITFADAAAATKARAAMDGKNICGAKLFVSSL